MDDPEAAITPFTASVNRLPQLYQRAWLDRFGAKLGIADPGEDDLPLISDLLTLMARDGADFTNTFAALGDARARNQFTDRDAFDAWAVRWHARRPEDHAGIMARANPTVIPRNHRIEEVIAAAVAGDEAPFHALLDVVTRPFAPLDEARAPYARPPSREEEVTRTFCGT